LQRGKDEVHVSDRHAGNQGRINKKLMALHFSSSASTYDSHAALQREIAWQLVDWAAPRLSFPGGTQVSALDIGCGTGFLSGFLHDIIHPQSIVAIDLAGGMLSRARKLDASGTLRLVQADGEWLPFAPASFELVASSTAFQWFTTLADSLAGISNALTPGGRLLFATLGRGTLTELKESYREAAGRMGITLTAGRYGPSLPGEVELVNALELAGLDEITTECRTKYEFFPSCRAFVRSLKARGANNPNFRPMSFATERRLMSLMSETYERRFSADGSVYASYEVIFCSCRKGKQ
jgi:malonyl-CoA O-methyltransferase